MTDNPTLPLVEQLRYEALGRVSQSPVRKVLHEAADALEAAQKRVSELEAALVRTQETIRDAANGEEPRFGELWRAIDTALAKDEITSKGENDAT